MASTITRIPTGGKGVDITIDVAGGDGLNKSVLATMAAGVIAQVGFLTGQTTQLQRDVHAGYS